MTVSVAEDILPGHPDRIADAIAERIVDEAVRFDPDAIASIETALHRDRVFVTGHIRAGALEPPAIQLDELVRAALLEAGYTGRWGYRPRIAADLLVEPLGGDDDRAARRVSEDQNIVVGHAEGAAATGYVPPVVHVVRSLRRALVALRAESAGLLGPDGKLLARIRRNPDGAHSWERVSVSIQHAPGPVDYQAFDALVLPALCTAAKELDSAVPGLADSWDDRLVRVNGAGDFSRGGPFADNGQTGRKLVVDHYGPGVPIGGGALTGKDPHKVDRAGALAARHLAVNLLAALGAGVVTVQLGWLPGEPCPDTFYATVDGDQWDGTRIRSAVDVPDLSIDGIVRRYELTGTSWAQLLRDGCIGNRHAWDTPTPCRRSVEAGGAGPARSRREDTSTVRCHGADARRLAPGVTAEAPAAEECGRRRSTPRSY